MLALMHPSHGAPPDGAHRRPPSRTKWTRLVHPSVLIGHVSSLCPPPAGPRRLAVAGPSPAPLPTPAPQKSIPKVNSLPPTYVPLPQAACQSAPRPAPRAPPARPLSPHHLRPQNELPAQRPRPHAESTTLPWTAAGADGTAPVRRALPRRRARGAVEPTRLRRRSGGGPEPTRLRRRSGGGLVRGRRRMPRLAAVRGVAARGAAARGSGRRRESETSEAVRRDK